MLKELEIELSKFEKIKNPKEKLEQYNTPERTALESILLLERELERLIVSDKKKIKVLDACAGTGFLSLAFLLFLDKYLGIKDVEVELFLVEIDRDLESLLKKNFEKAKEILDLKVQYKIFIQDFFEFNERNFDFILMNPPFGIQQKKKKDIDFLKKALELRSKEGFIISFHLANSLDFLKRNFKIKDYIFLNFEIKRQFWFHNKEKKEVEVVAIKL